MTTNLFGSPVPNSGAPTHGEALMLLMRIEQLISTNKRKDRETALGLLKFANSYKVYTKNILNPEAGWLEIEARSFGGCCDPGTETYHSM